MEGTPKENPKTEYKKLKEQCKLTTGSGWSIEIAYRPILPGHLMVYAIDENGEKIKGALKNNHQKSSKSSMME